MSAAYALTEGDASGPAQTLLAADTESDSDPDERGDADTDVEIDPDGVDFGRYITKSEAQWRKNKNDSWHSWDELAGGALGYGDGLKFRLEYTLPTGSLWKNGTDQPDTIIFYQLPETLKNFTGSDKVYADHVAVGEYEIRDGVVTIHFTDMDYIGKSKESDIKGTIELSGTVSQLKADDNGKVELDFNKDVRFEMTVKPKPVDLSIVKKGIQKDVANNKITYQVTVSTEEGTQGTPVLLHDVLQLNLGKALVGAKYDENSLKVSLDVEKNGNDKIYENTAPEGETANGWSVKTAADGKSFDLTLPALEAGESYTISGLISKSGEWHTDHTITWTVKLNQNNADLTGTVLRDFFGGTDETNELKNQEAKMKRVAAKLGDRYQKEGIGVEENGDTLTLNWELILNPVRAQNGWTLTDTLKDGQYLTAEQKNDLKTKLEALPGFGTGTVTFGADGKSFTAKGTGEWPANRQERITYSSTWDRDTSTVKGYAFTNAATFENYTVTGTNYYHEGTVVQKLDVSTGETETGGTTNHEYHELKNGKLVWNVVITMSDKMKKAASFTITENLPEGVKLEGLTFKQGDFFTGDVKFQSNEEETSWTASANGAPVTAEVAEDGKIELTVPQAVYNNPDLRNKTITLEVTVTPVNVAEWEHDTTHRFRNSVTVTSSTLPEGGYTAFQEQDIFYNQNYNAIAKTGKKLDNALNQVQYQIVVNPDGVTFLDGKERLKLVDTLTNHAVLSGTSSQGTSSGSDNRNLLQTGVAYRMVELEAPHGYELRMEPFDFYIDTEPANTPKDYAGQLCFTGQRVFIPNTRGYYDPQLTKNILESGSPVKRNNAKPGETVQFQTAIQVAHGQPSKYVLHDAMSGLNFDAASLKITHPVGDESGKQIEQTLKENIDYTLKKDCEDGCAFEITFSDERLTPGDLLTLTYSATVREDAVVEGEGNPNTTWLEYADPTGSSTTGEEETRTVVPEEPKVPEQPSEPKQPPVIPTPIDPSEVPEEPAGSDSREEPPASPDDSLRPGAPGPDNQDGWVLGAHGTAGNPAAEAPADSTAAAPMPDNHKNKVMGAVDSLIQTGQLNWPIPVLLALGGALVLAGLVLTRRKNRR